MGAQVESTIAVGGIRIAKVLNSLALISVVLLVLQLCPPICFYVLVLSSIGIGVHELYRLLAKAGTLCFRKAGLVLGMALGIASAIGSSLAPRGIFSSGWVELTIILALLSTTMFALLGQESPFVVSALSGTLFGIMYVGLLASYLISLRKLPHGENYASLAFIVTWARDAGAYGVGSLLKRGHVLLPRISPRKTFEGAMAGLVFALGFALLARWIWFPDQGWLHFVAIGCFVGVLGQAGDLTESMLKRNASVRDSGTLLPLHGGVLDRIDGLLFTAPVLYYYARLVMKA